MTSQELAKLCKPQTPEEVLENLKDLYHVLSNSPGWVSDYELETLNAAIEVFKAVYSTMTH